MIVCSVLPNTFISGYTEIAKGIRSISCHNCNPFVTQQCSTIVCFMLPSTFHLRGYIEIAKGIGSISYHNCKPFSFLAQQCSTTNGWQTLFYLVYPCSKTQSFGGEKCSSSLLGGKISTHKAEISYINLANNSKNIFKQL